VAHHWRHRVAYDTFGMVLERKPSVLDRRWGGESGKGWVSTRYGVAVWVCTGERSGLISIRLFLVPVQAIHES